MKRAIYLMFLCLVVSSCQKEEIQPQFDQISIHTAAISRATDLSFDMGDKIGMWLLNGDSEFTSAQGNYKNNILWQRVEDGWDPSEPVIYPYRGSKLDYYAYYPYDANIIDVTSYNFGVSTDQTTHHGYTESDFLFSTEKLVSSNTLDVNFQHKMSRVVLNLKLGSEMASIWPNITAIKIGDVALQTTINLSTGAVVTTPNGQLGDILAQVNKVLDKDGTTITGIWSQAIVVPQQVAAGSTFITIVTPEKEYKYTTTSPIELNSSTSYNFNVTMRGQVLVMNSVNITDWVAGWTYDENLTRAVAHDFTTYSQDILDFSFTAMHLCLDINKSVIALLCKEYIQPLDSEVIVVYPMTNTSIVDFPMSGYIVSTGQRVEFSKTANIISCVVGDEPEDFDGVYRTVEGKFIFSSKNYVLTDPTTTPYTIQDFRPKSTLGYQNDERGEETFTYGVVKVGLQMWLKQNLKTSKLSKGYPLRIGQIGLTPSSPPSDLTWSGWFGRSLPSCAIYGDDKQSAYSPNSGERNNSTVPLSELLERREKYGVLYNYHAVNAHNDPSITKLPSYVKNDFKLSIIGTKGAELEIPTNEEWKSLIKYLSPSQVPNDMTVQNGEVFIGLMPLLERAGLVSSTQYGGHLEYVTTPGGNNTKHYLNLDNEISFWSRDVAVVDPAPENNTAWVWHSTGAVVSPHTRQQNFSAESRFIREGHSVRLMINLTNN